MKAAVQKLSYIPFKPVRGRWQLAFDYLQQLFSATKFYETGFHAFGLLRKIFAELYGEEKDREMVRVPGTKAERSNHHAYYAGKMIEGQSAKNEKAIL